VVAGAPSAPGSAALLRAIHSVYQPNKVVLGTLGPVEPFARTLKPADGEATAFICTGTSCQAPTHEAEVVRRFLQ
jgi:uncharacterized protein YyaL (SSP411 family)